MPRYFFNFFDEGSKNLARDSEGASLPNANAAKKEALELAQDIVDHRLHGSAWQVVVTDANAAIVLSLPLSEIHPRRMRAWFDRVRHLAMYEARVRSHIFTWLLMLVVLAIILEAVVLSRLSRDRTGVSGTPFVSSKWQSWYVKARVHLDQPNQ
jgi:hypothetical protein